MSEKNIKVGQRVEVPSKDTCGTVAYVGNTHFSNGKWIGVVLDEKKGKNNGIVQGKSYFQCEEGYGTFVRQTQVIVIDGEEEDASSDTTKSSNTSAVTTPIVEKPKSSLRRKPIGSQVPQKPDRLRLPLGAVGKMGTPQKGGLDERPAGKESPSQELKKAPAFIEGFVSTAGASAAQGTDGTNFMEALTPQFSPGPVTTLHTLEDKANAFHAQQTIDNLKAENLDLSEKLETLRIKRAQDKDKLKEGEKLRIQVEQLTEFKTRIMESQAQLQKELQKARQEAKEAVEARERHVEETEELIESVELLTLDKEMAEEKAETLQLELDQTREKVEELVLDLEILRAEAAETEDGVLNLEGKAPSTQVKQLEQQNTRLRETLIRMRDISAHDKHELQKAQKDVEATKVQLTDMTRENEKLKAQLTQVKATVADLQEQVDAAMGAEEMCETLTERNLDLEERVAELEEAVADLEAINDTNDQLQENCRELELELREDLDMANAKIREAMKEREALNEVIVDQDTTIKKFRDLVQKIQEQNLELRHSLEKETNKPMGTPNEIIDFKKMFSEAKAQSKAIDLELRRLEVTQANQHVNFLMQYLPDTFTSRGGDHDAVLVLLLLPRIVWKTDIIAGGLRDRFPPPEIIDRPSVLKSHAVDQCSFSSRMLLMLYMLQAIVQQYQHMLNTCSVERFLKFGTLYPEMASHERNLDVYIDLMRKDQMDETVVTEHLEKTVAYFQTVYPTHLSGQKLEQSFYLSAVGKVLQSASQAINIEAARIEVLLSPSEMNNSETGSLLQSLKTISHDVGNTVKRIKRRLPQDGSTGPLSYPEHVQDVLTASMNDVYNASRALRHVAKTCMQQTSLIGDCDGGIPSQKVREFLHQATDLIYGAEDQGPESIRTFLTATREAIAQIANTLEKGEFDFDGTSDKEPIPPLSLLAEAIKKELKETEHLKYKLETKEQDVKELKMALKQKNEELSEMTVRRDMADKKLSTATRDADITIEKLQRKLDDTLMMLRRKEKEFDETMDHLQSDIESLESEKGELREKLKAQNKRTLYEALNRSSLGQGVMSPSLTPTSVIGSSVITSSSGVMVTDSPLLLQQIASLKASLSAALDVKYYTIVSDMRRKLAALKPLNLDHFEDESANDPQSKKLKELTDLAAQLRNELNNLYLSLDVVDITKRKPGTEPATQSLSPMNHLINHKLKVAALEKRLQNVQDELAKVMASRHPAGSINTSFTSFPTPQFVKAAAENDFVKIGRITVPGSHPSAPLKKVSVVIGAEEFSQLKRILLS